MDDHSEIERHASEELIYWESKMLARTTQVFFSSSSLAGRVVGRNPDRKFRFTVVNNSYSPVFALKSQESLQSTQLSPKALSHQSTAHREATVTVGYFGTVASWFDWDLLDRLLLEFPQLMFLIAGPIESSVTKRPNVHHVGVLNHVELRKLAKECDLFIMPFSVNGIVEVVDPVKLYEYIALEKYFMAPRYCESERFSEFGFLYEDLDECIAIFRKIVCGELVIGEFPSERAIRFLNSNSWNVRCEKIDVALSKM